jgi:O-antigen ligase
VALLLISRASGAVRIACLAAIPILILLVAAVLPQTIRSRYLSLFDDNSRVQTEADASYEARQYMLRTSLRFTAENPLFGVGPGEFSDSEGREATAKGQHGTWQVSHNAYTQLSSEMGIPAMLFYLGAIVSAFRMVNRERKKCRNVPQLRMASAAAFCLTLAMVGFGVAIFFLSLAYTFYFPFITGLCIALARAIQRESPVEHQPANTRLQRFPAVPVYPGA